MRNYQEEIKIDLAKLEENLRDQPESFLYWSEQHANAIFERDKIKQKIDITKAELDAYVRKNWDSLDFEKPPTEAAISSWIVREKNYQKLNEELIDSIRKVNLYSAAEKAFDQRKNSLKPLADLYVAGYWSKPKVSDKVKDELGANQFKMERQKALNEKKSQLQRKEKE